MTLSRRLYGGVIAAWIIYAVLTLFGPVANAGQYHLSFLALLLLRLTIILPLLIIWLVAARGALRFWRYAGMLHGSPEEPAMRNIARGLIWAAVYIVSIGLPGAVLPYIHDETWRHIWIGLDTFLPLVLSLVAFVQLYLGSQLLGSVGHFVTWTRRFALVVLLYLVFCVVFVMGFVYHPDFLHGNSADTSITGVLTTPQLLVGVVLPYLVLWFLGLVTCANITKFSRYVTGSLYRRALRGLVAGIVGIIVFAVVLQALTLVSPALEHASLGILLLVVYGLVILYAVGFAFIAVGSRQLIQIEGAE